MTEMTFLKELILIKQVHLKVCDICHDCYFLDKRLKVQLNVCNGCHYALMMPINIDDIAILNIRGVFYCCIITGISKSDAVNLQQNANLTEGRRLI